MNVGIGLVSDQSVEELARVVVGFHIALGTFFRDKSYGSDVENLAIGVILVAPDGDRLHPVRKLRYTKRWTLSLTKQVYHNVVEFYVKPDFAIFSQLSPEQAKPYFARSIVAGSGVLAEHQMKYPNFDVARFREDLKACLEA